MLRIWCHHTCRVTSYEFSKQLHAQLFSHVPLFYNPMDCSPAGFFVHGVFQARILEWVATSFLPEGGLVANPGIKPVSPASLVLADRLFTTVPPGKPLPLFQIRFIKVPQGFPGGSAVKKPHAIAGDRGLILGSGRSPGGGNGYPLQYSCLENSMARGTWRATVNGVAKSGAQLSD